MYMWTHRTRHAENSNIGSYPPVQCNFLINSRHPAVCEILRLMCYYTKQILYNWNRLPAANSRAHFLPFFSLFLSEIIAKVWKFDWTHFSFSRRDTIFTSISFHTRTCVDIFIFIMYLCEHCFECACVQRAQPLRYNINKCF